VPTADAAQLDRAFHALADESRRAIVVQRVKGPVELLSFGGRHAPDGSTILRRTAKY